MKVICDCDTRSLMSGSCSRSKSSNMSFLKFLLNSPQSFYLVNYYFKNSFSLYQLSNRVLTPSIIPYNRRVVNTQFLLTISLNFLAKRSRELTKWSLFNILSNSPNWYNNKYWKKINTRGELVWRRGWKCYMRLIATTRTIFIISF